MGEEGDKVGTDILIWGKREIFTCTCTLFMCTCTLCVHVGGTSR